MLRMSEQDFDAVIGTNLKGTFNMIPPLLRAMMPANPGASSTFPLCGLGRKSGQANYSARRQASSG